MKRTTFASSCPVEPRLMSGVRVAASMQSQALGGEHQIDNARRTNGMANRIKGCLAVALSVALAPAMAQDLDDILGPSEAEPTGAAKEAAPVAPPPTEEPAATSTEPVAATPAATPAATEASATPAPADGKRAEKVAAPTKNRLLEEIIVTAEKREENIQTVPISISAFSAAALDAKGIDDPKALAQSTPGVYYGQTVNFAIIYIRGVGSDAFLPDSDPSVASYIDGIYFPFANGLSQSFGAVERVEVLKGPQGTLFGRNSTGGAFNTITKSPGREPEVSLLTSYGSFDQLRTRAYVSLPFGDSFAASVSATYNSEENYYKGTRGSGVDAGTTGLPREIGKGVRLKTKWDISESLDLNLAAFQFNQNGLSSTAIPNVSPSLLLTLASTALGTESRKEEGKYQVDVDVPSYFSVNNKVFYGQLNYRPEWFDIKLLGSSQKIVSDNVYDFDGTNTPLITFDARGQFADVKTGEVQLLSNGVFGPDWLKWIAGGFYLDQTSGFPLNRLSVLSLDVSDGNLLGVVPVPPAISDLLTQLPRIPDGGSVGLVSLLGTKSQAAFSQATVDFTDWLHLTVGGRYQREQRRVIESSASISNLDGTTTPLPTVPQAPLSAKTSNFSPKATLGVNPIDGVLTYFSYSRGYKSGTFNTVNVYNAPEYVKPEIVDSLELGMKSEWLDGALRFNAAVFQNKISELQVQFISLLSGGAVSLENAGGAKIRGFEFDFQASPLPELNPGLVIAAGGTFLDSRYTSYTRGSGYTVNAQGNYDGAGIYNFRSGDFTGNQVTRTPKFSGTANLNQIISFGDGDFELGASAYYNSGFFFLASNAPVSRQDSYISIDAQVSYIYNPWKSRVTVFGKNLTDARYAYSQFHTDAGRQDYLAPPLTVGVRVTWEY